MTQSPDLAKLKPRSQAEKLAILMVSLGEDLASELIQKLPRDDAAKILQAMTRLGRLDQATINQVQLEFKDLMSVFQGSDLTDGSTAAQRII